MKKEEIQLWDIQRILFGQAPPALLLEVFIRSLLIYIAAIMVLCWMGKRMNGQLTIIELAVMVMMGDGHCLIASCCKVFRKPGMYEQETFHFIRRAADFYRVQCT